MKIEKDDDESDNDSVDENEDEWETDDEDGDEEENDDMEEDKGGRGRAISEFPAWTSTIERSLIIEYKLSCVK